MPRYSRRGRRGRRSSYSRRGRSSSYRKRSRRNRSYFISRGGIRL